MNIFAALLPGHASVHSSLSKLCSAADHEPKQSAFEHIHGLPPAAQTPTGSRPPAQGCEERATLGLPPSGPNPEGVPHLTVRDLNGITISPEQIRLGHYLDALFARVVAFQRAKFPGQSLRGKLNHLVKESQELRDNPGDPNEWADVLILLLGAAELNGWSALGLVIAAQAKMDINDTREWHPPDAQGCYHHIKP